ncbi:unnamed protein product [Phaedon cochleariae]|uniref:Uncharacterized protein n=1 Tax=Phaedon cochleariae TaxID=80249 RepID=A0A9N9SHM8_PHACE|nr:unnamed protein product [Phaedon cochleariae]
MPTPIVSETSKGTSSTEPPQTKKGEKPPPIIFDGILRDRKEIIPLIKSLTVKKFYFKYGNESTLLYTESTEDFENVKRRLKEDEVSFYTYALKKDKTHAFVLRGLDFEPEPSEIIEEMEQEHKIKVKEVYRLNTRYRPLYLYFWFNGHMDNTAHVETPDKAVKSLVCKNFYFTGQHCGSQRGLDICCQLRIGVPQQN